MIISKIDIVFLNSRGGGLTLSRGGSKFFSGGPIAYSDKTSSKGVNLEPLSSICIHA